MDLSKEGAPDLALLLEKYNEEYTEFRKVVELAQQTFKKSSFVPGPLDILGLHEP